MADTEERSASAPEAEAAGDSMQIELWRRWLGEARKERAVADKERDRAIRYIRGGDAQWERVEKEQWGGTRITANYLFPTLKVLLPHLVPRSPRGLIMPSSVGTAVASEVAPVLEEKIAYDWREGHYLRQVGKAVNEALIGGCGWLRVSWDKERQIPEVKHCKPNRILIDPEADQELAEAGWIAEKVTMRVADIKADSFFENADRLKAETYGTRYNEVGDGSAGAASLTARQKEALSTVDVWYIWSRRGVGHPRARADQDQGGALGDNVLLCYAEGHDFWLHKGPWPLVFDHDEFPYRLLRFNYDPERFLAFGPFQPALAAQEFLNWQVSFLVQHTKKGAAAKIVYDKNAVNQEQLARIFNGVDYEGIAVDFMDGGKKPFEVVDLQTDPTKIESTISLALKVMFDITGASEIIMGGQGKTQSATEADIRERRAQNRIDDMRDAVKDLLIDVNRGIAMVEKIKTPPRTEGDSLGIDFFLGNAAIRAWEKFTALDMKAMRAEIMFDVDAGTMRRPTREQQIQDLFGLWDRLGTLYAEMGRWEDLQRLIARVIRALELPDPQELIPAQLGPPAEQLAATQQAQQMQMQQAQAQEQAMMGMQQGLQGLAQQAGAAIQQLQSEVASVRSEGQQALQAAFQGFQVALASAPKPVGVQIASQGPVSLATQSAEVGSQMTNVQAGQMVVQAQDIAMNAENVVSQASVVASASVTRQHVVRDALGRITEVVAETEPVGPAQQVPEAPVTTEKIELLASSVQKIGEAIKATSDMVGRHTNMIQETMEAITVSGVASHLTTAAKQEVQRTADQASDAISAMAAEAQENVNRYREEAEAPIAFKQIVKRDQFGRIAEIDGVMGSETGGAGPGGPDDAEEER